MQTPTAEKPETKQKPSLRKSRRPRTPKYQFTDEIKSIFDRLYTGRSGCVKDVRAALKAAGINWPLCTIQYVAKCHGYQKSRTVHFWTEEELETLRLWSGRRNAKWIAKRLGLTEAMVAKKLNRMGYGAAVNDGCTLTQLAACFGVSHATVRGWIESGKLIASRQHTERESDIYRISDEAIKDFVKRYPTAYKLHQVDQTWFLGFVLGELGVVEERETLAVGGVRRKAGLSVRAERGGVNLGELVGAGCGGGSYGAGGGYGGGGGFAFSSSNSGVGVM